MAIRFREAATGCYASALSRKRLVAYSDGRKLYGKRAKTARDKGRVAARKRRRRKPPVEKLPTLDEFFQSPFGKFCKPISSLRKGETARIHAIVMSCRLRAEYRNVEMSMTARVPLARVQGILTRQEAERLDPADVEYEMLSAGYDDPKFLYLVATRSRPVRRRIAKRMGFGVYAKR